MEAAGPCAHLCSLPARWNFIGYDYFRTAARTTACFDCQRQQARDRAGLAVKIGRAEPFILRFGAERGLVIFKSFDLFFRCIDMSHKLHWKHFAPHREAFHIQSDLRIRQWGAGYHTHDFSEVFWIYTGHGRHRINGETQELKTGHLVFIRPSDTHNIETIPPSPLGLVNVAFPVRTLHYLRQRYFGDTKRWFWKRTPLPEICLLEAARLARIQEWADNLVAAPHNVFEIERFLMNLLHMVTTGIEQESLPAGAPDWLAAACHHIRERENMQKGVAAWVRLAGRGPEHVARTTRKWLGLSPTDYVNQVRLAFVERQLRLTSSPILDLSLEAGFPNLGHLYKLFKRKYGLPPRQYRQKHRKIIV
jgi:AraC family cel operon transcriptional repressor